MTLATERRLAFHCPFPAAIHPAADDIQRATTDWAVTRRLVRSEQERRLLDGYQFGVLMARAYPGAPVDRLRLIADWNTWLFLLDDIIEHECGGHVAALQQVQMQILAVLRGAAPDAGDVQQCAAAEIRDRMLAAYTTDWFHHLVDELARSFTATLWEADNRRTAHVPSEDAYCAQRPYTSAVYCYFRLIDLGEDADMESLRTSSDTQRLALAANNVICWANDVLSYAKEQARQDAHNYITVAQHARGLSFDAAIDYVMERHNAEARVFQERASALLPLANDACRRYLRGMAWWMRANLDWSHMTMRYATSKERTA